MIVWSRMVPVVARRIRRCSSVVSVVGEHIGGGETAREAVEVGDRIPPRFKRHAQRGPARLARGDDFILGADAFLVAADRGLALVARNAPISLRQAKRAVDGGLHPECDVREGGTAIIPLP